MVMHAQNEGMNASKRPKMRSNYIPVNQMVPATDREVDTLSILDRIALRTNLVDLALMIPNIGAEFDVKGTNWNRWTVGFNVRYNWQTSHTYTHFLTYNFFEARLEGRQYWRARRIGDNTPSGKRIGKHRNLWNKAIAIRRSKVKHPVTTWYRGVFVAYNSYSFLIPNKGHQGSSYMAGVSYGFVRPMLGLGNGNTIDLEFGISGGVVYYKDDTYKQDVQNDCYTLLESKPAQLLKFPMLNEVRVGFIYRLGQDDKAKVLSKYRYRRDVDKDYDIRLQRRYDSIMHRRDSIKNYDKNYNIILQRFWHVYDSIAMADKAKRMLSLNDFNPSKPVVEKPKKDKLKKDKGKKEKPEKEKPKKEKPAKPKKEKKSKKGDAQKGGDDA